MADVETNLRLLRPSRKKPKTGDLFVIQMRDERVLFGRVINDNAVSGLGIPGAILVYVYSPPFSSMEPPERSLLSPSRLLVSPMMTNRLPWSRGYFQTVAHWPLETDDVLPQHCFLSAVRGRYYDDRGNELSGPVEPVGDYGLQSFRTIDDQVSDALGLARAPD